MEILNKSTGETLFDLTCYAEDTLASRLAPQANAKANKIRDIYGRGFERPLATYDPSMSCWKMCVDILPLVEPPLLEKLPPSGMTVNGELYLQPAWEQITEEIGYSLWPTMSANGMGNEGSQQILDRRIVAGCLTEAEKRAMTAGNGGRLNPTWVEWLMGFPTGWTDLED